jgi:prepilin-type processing-associated H-X9-DG protein
MTTPNFDGGLLSVLSNPMTPQTVQSVIPSFRCPSDVGSALAPSIVSVNDLTKRYSFGRSNYVAVAGTDPAWVNEASGGSSTSFGDVVGDYRVNVGVVGAFLVRQGDISTATVTTDAYGGAFGSNSKRGFRDMTDGSSHAIIVGERYSPVPFPWFAISMGEANWVGIPDDLSSQSQGQVLGEASVSINAFLSAPTPRPPTTGFGSLHGGGCHFLMGDGSVRFISQNVDLTTYRQLSRIADGAVVGNF